MPKFPDASNSKLEVKVYVNKLRIVDIDYLKSSFNARFWLDMKWSDSRVTFNNIQHQKETQLTKEDMDKLWLPALNFEVTPKISRTTRDDALIMKVTGYNKRPQFDLTKLHDDINRYTGADVTIEASRLYNEIFTCEFQLQMYPFDSQICNMTFTLAKHQATFVQLVLPCMDKDKEITVGEFQVTKIERYQPADETSQIGNRSGLNFPALL